VHEFSRPAGKRYGIERGRQLVSVGIQDSHSDEAEVLILRQKINVLHRRMPTRPDLNNTDRFLFVWLYRLFPSLLGAIALVRPETIVRWLSLP
jgi:hypothetical protein